MEKQVFATLKIDTALIDERLKAVIDAKEALDEAVYELERATGADGMTVQMEKPVEADGL